MSNKWILSATEIDTFETCRRKWGFHYLDGIKSSASKSAETGLLVHAYLQNYLSGKATDPETTEAQIASSGLMYLPKKLPEENIERHFAFTANSHVFQGYIDFFENLGNQKWLIGDHKTCSSLSSALSPEQLKKNIQANIYAQWAFREKDAKEVTLRWVYYRTKSKPKALCVETALTHNEAKENFETITKTADAIKNIIAAPRNLANFPKNESACFKYGPCPFYAQCRPHSLRYQSKATEVVKMSNASTPNTEAKKPSFHLYVDCAPTKREAAYESMIELSDLLRPILHKIQKEKELSHYRLAGYGQHVGLIANYLSQHLQENAYDHRTAILSSIKTPEGCDTLQTLTAAAGHVVRGF